MERARYRQSDLRRMALGVRTIPSLFIALTSYKLLAVLLLMETFLLPGTFVVGGLALPACTLLFLACSLVCLAFAMLFRRLTFHDHSWYLGLLIACLMLGLFLLLLRELGGVGNAALASACRGLGIALVAAGLIGVHIEMARIMGALGMTQTLTFGVSAAFAAGLLYLALTLWRRSRCGSCLPPRSAARGGTCTAPAKRASRSPRPRCSFPTGSSSPPWPRASPPACS